MKILRLITVLLLVLQVVGFALVRRVYSILHGGPAWDATPEAQVANAIWVGTLLVAVVIGIVYVVLVMLKKAPRDRWMTLLIVATILPTIILGMHVQPYAGG